MVFADAFKPKSFYGCGAWNKDPRGLALSKGVWSRLGLNMQQRSVRHPWGHSKGQDPRPKTQGKTGRIGSWVVKPLGRGLAGHLVPGRVRTVHDQSGGPDEAHQYQAGSWKSSLSIWRNHLSMNAGRTWEKGYRNLSLVSALNISKMDYKFNTALTKSWDSSALVGWMQNSSSLHGEGRS